MGLRGVEPLTSRLSVSTHERKTPASAKAPRGNDSTPRSSTKDSAVQISFARTPGVPRVAALATCPLTHADATATLSEWAASVGLPWETLALRLLKGWPMAQALAAPASVGAPPASVMVAPASCVKTVRGVATDCITLLGGDGKEVTHLEITMRREAFTRETVLRIQRWLAEDFGVVAPLAHVAGGAP